jgi:DNA-binding NarL/FixJ family response regulator
MAGGVQTTVLLVDDHAAFTDALVLAIDRTDDLRSVGTASSLAQALVAVSDLHPHVVVLDLGLPDASDVEAVVRLRRLLPEQRILVLTGTPDLDLLTRAVDAGASGVLLKHTSLAAVLDAIRNLPTHCVLIQRALLTALRQPAQPPLRSAGHPSRLTARELDVLRLLAAGYAPKAIASELGIAVSTCREYVKSVLAKLGAHSQLEAVSVARREQLIA